MKSLEIFDGSNFYHFCKRVSPDSHLTHFKYRKFVETLLGEKDLYINYYVGEVKWNNNLNVQKLYNNQQSLFLWLRKNKVNIKLGYLLKSGGKYHEKGVDVQMAVDIVKGAIKGDYDKFYLISSDTDLIPAIEIAKSENKKVIYVSFEHKVVSHALKNICTDQVIITKKMIEKFAG